MAFDYTTGNPNNLTGGLGANMLDIQGPFLDLKSFLNQRIAAIPTLVTNLPAGPVDGQEVYYLADSTNGVVWHLRYRSASGSASKWEFVGGRPLRAAVLGNETKVTTATADLATVLSVTAALAGDYDVEWGFGVQFPGTAVAETASSDVFVAGVAQSRTTITRVLANTTTADAFDVHRKERLTGVAGGAAISVRYGTGTTNTYTFYRRYLEIVPVRVG
jgi:hypothetical protein